MFITLELKYVLAHGLTLLLYERRARGETNPVIFGPGCMSLYECFNIEWLNLTVV